MIPLAILCGGLGTRVRPYTQSVPKPMIDVAGEPFLAHVLRHAAASGVTDVVLLVGYLGEMIVDYVGTGTAFGLHVGYAHDGPAPRGTAGAVASAREHLGERFFVSFGDAYLDVDYASVCAQFEASGRRGLMTVYPATSDGERPNTAIAGDRVTAYSKQAPTPEMQYVDYGLSAFHASAFDEIASEGAFDLTGVNHRLIEAGQMAAFRMPHAPFEIGSIAGLEATKRFFLSRGG
jgi:NDP-sugar pyrophosphorylase family protein